MLDKLSAPARAKVQPFLQRMEAFEGKMTARVQEIRTEAEAGFKEIIEMNPLEANALSAAFNAVKGRIMGLREKIQGAEEKLSQEWDEATGELDLEGEELAAVNALWSGLVNRSRKLQDKLELWSEEIEMTHSGNWARTLQKMSVEELKRPRQCPSCGAAMNVEIKHAASTVTCPHCGSANELEVGPATGLFYQGLGVHALSHEAAWKLWLAQHEAERAFHFFRHPTDADRQAYLDAAKAYWTAYYQHTHKVHPDPNLTVEKGVEAKLAHYQAYDQPQEQQERAYFGKLVHLAKAKDRKGLEAHMQAGSDLDACAEAIHEHGDREGATLALQIQHRLADESDDLDEWVGEKLRELDQQLAQR